MRTKNSHPTLLALHGGAGVIQLDSMSAADRARRVAGLREALSCGWRCLQKGDTALEAVLQTVAVLEDDPAFNAGRGSVLTSAGDVEMEAAVMNGSDARFAALSGLRRLRNPVLALRRQLERQQVYRCGREVEQELVSLGEPAEEADWFRTPERVQQLELARMRQQQILDHSGAFGTVGAVARDCMGELAAATSTGGMTNKAPGRIGDTPLIGAGTWASVRIAVSATGTGEAFMRAVFAHTVEEAVRLAEYSLEQACDTALERVRELGGSGGCVAVSEKGELCLPFNSSGMYRAWVDSAGDFHIGIGCGEEQAGSARLL